MINVKLKFSNDIVKINKGLNGEIVQKSSQVKVQISSSQGLVLYRKQIFILWGD